MFNLFNVDCYICSPTNQDPLGASDKALTSCGPYKMKEDDAMVYRKPYLTSGSSGFSLNAISSFFFWRNLRCTFLSHCSVSVFNTWKYLHFFLSHEKKDMFSSVVFGMQSTGSMKYDYWTNSPVFKCS